MIRLPVFVIALMMAFTAVARADGPQLATAAGSAFEALAAYTDQAIKAKQRPAFNKPPATEYIARVTDAQGLAALPAPKGSDLEWLLSWQDAARKTYRMLIATGVAGSEAERQAAIQRNFVENEEALFRTWAFMVRLQARMMVTGDMFMDSLPPEERTQVRKRGQEGFRGSAIQFIQEGLGAVSSGIKRENVLRVTAALRDTAPIWTTRLMAAERDRLKLILNYVSKNYQDQALLDEIAWLTQAVEAAKPI
jgi:hypothetical protein